MKFLSSEEVNFYVELAVDECERWIQRVTREPFLDHEDFLYSLRYGTHLRRLINFIFPSSFHFSKLVPSTSKSVFSAVGLSIEDLPLVDDDDWVVQFLLICLYRLRIPESDLFYAEDLIDFEDSSSEVIDEYLKRVDGGCRSLNDRLRRVCLTISALSSRISHSRPHIPQFDNSAVEPLAEYHSFVIRSQSSERENHLIFDRPTLAVVECLKEIIDKTVASSSLPSTSSRSLNVYAMDSAEYKVNRFLQDLGGEQTDATDDFSYSSLSRSSALGGVDHLKEITTIPTRVQQKISSLPPSDPLHFVSVHSGGLTLAEHAKQMMSVTETQRRQRQQELENMPRSADDEESWMADLDTWRRKRKQKKTGESIESYQPTTTTTNLANKSKDQKDEILHISSPYQEVDSGIERTSPSTSLDFSPRSDLKSSTSDYASPSNLRSTSHGYDRQRSETPPPDHAPPPPPVEEHIYSESERQRAREKLDQVLIEVAVPKNRRQTLEEEFPSPPPQYKPIETAAYYDGSRFREESARVETVLHVPTETQRVDQNLRIEEDRYSNDSEKSVLVELTVELNREQIGKVSTQYPIPPESNRTSDRRRPSLTYQYSSSTPERSRSLERYERRELSDYEMAPPVGTIYKTVDIPFDDSSISAYQPKQRDSKSGDGSFSLVLDMGSQPVHKGFGFSVSGVRSPTIRVETVVVDTPADRGGLQVGDQLISINGESVADQYPSAISRMLHEAARLGEAELRLVRRDNVKLTVSATNSQRSNNSFDKTRNMFQDAVQDTSVSSFSEFKKRHSVGSVKSGNVSRRDSQSTITPSSSFGDVIRGNGLERSSTDNSTELYRTPVQSFRDLPIRNSDVILNRDALDRDVGFRKSYGTEGVKTVVDRSHPGKLSDFIPEVERAAAVAQGEHAWDERRREMESAIAQRSSEDVPRIMRNYDLRPTQSINPSYERRNSDEDSVSAVMTRSTLPRNTSGKAFNDYDNEETVVEDGRSYLDPREWRSVIKSQRQPAPGQPISTERLQPTTQSLSNLPAIINKRMREQEEKYKREQEITDRENKYYGIDYSRQEQQQKQQRLSDQMSHQNERPRTMERQRRDFSEERREEKYNTPIYSLQHTPSADDYRSPTNGYRSQTLDRTPPSGSDYRAPNTINATTGSDRNLASIYTPNTVTKPTREAPVTPTAATRSMPEKTDSRSSNPQITKPTTVPTSNVSKSDPKTEKDNVVAVSGKHRCAHCDNELGRGQAMIIESLNLYYHLTCFKCFVCNTPLGNGQKGADVRVREGRLHCKSCYSNDQVQLSKV